MKDYYIGDLTEVSAVTRLIVTSAIQSCSVTLINLLQDNAKHDNLWYIVTGWATKQHKRWFVVENIKIGAN